ncbi:MAG: hypothetical protein HY800_10325 [Ignavibacteriales bacterium]|nr:hypothetical protein [Ignavibacteriales bacterium]
MMKKIEWKILFVWFLIIMLIRISLFLPHRYIDEIRLINIWLQVLLFIISFVITCKSRGSQQNIYLNLTLFFGFVIPLFLGSFVGQTILSNYRYASIYYHIYVNIFGRGLILFFLILYIFIDYLFWKTHIWKKYALSLTFALGVTLIAFSPYWHNPMHLYNNEDYVTYQQLHGVWTNLSHELNRAPSNEELIHTYSKLPNNNKLDNSNITSWLENGRSYLEAENVTPLFWKPLNRALMILNILNFVLLSIFLVIIYKLDRPYHPYVDKIIVFLILFYAVEAIHGYGATSSPSIEHLRVIITIGQYATVLSFLFLLYIFHLNLRFVTSSVNAYYEEAILTTPQNITRWRDEIDTFFLKYLTTNIRFIRRIAHTSIVNRKENIHE